MSDDFSRFERRYRRPPTSEHAGRRRFGMLVAAFFDWFRNPPFPVEAAKHEFDNAPAKRTKRRHIK